MQNKSERSRQAQRGSALVYILIAIALLAALTATFMDSSSEQTSAQSLANTVTEVGSQVNFIMSAIEECALVYPEGDATLSGTNNTPYPINPTSIYLTDHTTGVDYVRDARCPGNPGDSADHANIFGGTSGKFLPPPPRLLSDWIYYNGADGVFFYAETNKTDTFLTDALSKLDGKYAECQMDVVNATAGAVALSTDGASCISGYRCLRVWLKILPTATYNGDTEGDEANCPD